MCITTCIAAAAGQSGLVNGGLGDAGSQPQYGAPPYSHTAAVRFFHDYSMQAWSLSLGLWNKLPLLPGCSNLSCIESALGAQNQPMQYSGNPMTANQQPLVPQNGPFQGGSHSQPGLQQHAPSAMQPTPPAAQHPAVGEVPPRPSEQPGLYKGSYAQPLQQPPQDASFQHFSDPISDK